MNLFKIINTVIFLNKKIIRTHSHVFSCIVKFRSDFTKYCESILINNKSDNDISIAD